MNTILSLPEFDSWIDGLTDPIAAAAIATRIDRAADGLLGDCAPVGEGVSEMRIHVGKGYRVYFVKRGKVVLLLLCGGNKSTQKRDITRAKKLAMEN